MDKWVIVLLAVVLAVSGVSAGEELAGSLAGRVVDKDTRQPLPFVNVLVVGTSLGAITDERGGFEIRDLPTGVYNLQFFMIGYQSLVKNRVVVNSGRATFLRIELELEPVQMEDIVARPSFFEQAEDAVVSSRRMDSAEISSQPGGCYDVQRAIQALPAVVSATDQNNEVIVRGGNYGENLFIIDNIEIANPNHFAWQGTGGGPVNMINVDFVDQIDFIAGAFPAKYGDRASSVMDIRLREGSSEAFLLKLGMGMAGAGGSVEGPINRGRGTYMVSLYRSFLSLVASSFGLTVVPHYQNLQAKVVYDLTEKDKLILNGMFGNDWVFLEPDSEDSDSNEDTEGHAKTHQYAVGSTLRTLWSQNSYSLFTLSRTLNHWNQHITNTQKEKLYDNYSTEAENCAKLDYTWKPNPRSEHMAGLYLKQVQMDHSRWSRPDTLFHYEYDDSDTVVTDSTMVIDSATGQPYVFQADVKEDADSYKYGGYVQDKQRLSNSLALNAGLRCDYFAYTRRGYFSPRLGLSWYLTRNATLSLAYGRHYQSPQYYELTLDKGNHSLKSKYTDQWVLGLEQLFAEDLKGTVEVYYKNYRNVPISRSLTTPDPNDQDTAMLNKGRGYAKGVEFFLQKKVKEALWGTLSYSYSIAKAEDPRNPGKKFSWDFDFRNVLTMLVGYRKDLRDLSWYTSLKESWWYSLFSWLPFAPADEMEFSIRTRYIGGKPYTPYAWHPEWKSWTLDEAQQINSKRLPAYKRLDLFVNRRWFLAGWNIVSFIEIENVFNHKNIWDYTYNDDGTTETIYQMGRMVVGGVQLEF